MKNRLKDLIKDTLQDWECDVSEETVSEITEHLIENGVIVPKVKIGDKLYELSASKTKLYEVTVTHLEVHENDIRIWGKKPQWQEVKWICSQSDLGKNEWVFTTKEEAEKNMKRSENGKS